MKKIPKILVTGGFGFIGSNFINSLLRTVDEIEIYNVDFCGTGSNPKYLDYPRLRTQKIINFYDDINNIEKLMKGITGFDCIYHFAAESHVDRSIQSPTGFIKSNINGTLAMLEYHRTLENCRFVYISTDEVVGSIKEGKFKEDDILNPSSPYSAAKASGELLCKSYHTTYGSDIVITRCSNNFGENQYSEKFIPTIINNIINNTPIPVYDKGEQVREWTYVKHHIKDVLFVANYGKSGEIYNVGSGHEMKNIDMVKLISNILKPDYPPNVIFKENARPGHDFRYAIDTTKLQRLYEEHSVPYHSVTKEEFEEQIRIVVTSEYQKRMDFQKNIL